MKNFGKIISQKRKEAKLTQEAFAAKLSITPQAVSKWENGAGYPDVTLFPQIAEVLNVPITELFGMDADPKKTMEFLDKYQGMDFIFSYRNKACYSSKEVDRVDKEENTAYFTDGSIANLNSETVVNMGAGEIRILIEENIPYAFAGNKKLTETRFSKEIENFKSVKISLQIGCTVNILKSEDGKNKILAEGDPIFIDGIVTGLDRDILSLEFKSKYKNYNYNNNQLHSNLVYIYCSEDKLDTLELSVGGCGICRALNDFKKIALHINGSGEFAGEGAEEFFAHINGSGEVRQKLISKKADIQINGAGEFQIGESYNTAIRINGSGYVKVADARKGLSAVIRGSGDVECSGNAWLLVIDISGSGVFGGSRLTVEEARITALNSADIAIGHIKGTSTEKLGKNCSLKVGKRGI